MLRIFNIALECPDTHATENKITHRTPNTPVTETKPRNTRRTHAQTRRHAHTNTHPQGNAECYATRVCVCHEAIMVAWFVQIMAKYYDKEGIRMACVCLSAHGMPGPAARSPISSTHAIIIRCVTLFETLVVSRLRRRIPWKMYLRCECALERASTTPAKTKKAMRNPAIDIPNSTQKSQ